MDSQKPDRLMPGTIAWPLVTVNIVLAGLSAFNLVDHFRSSWSLRLSVVAAVIDMCLALAVFVRLKRGNHVSGRS